MRPVQEILNENKQTFYYKKDLCMIKNAWLNHVQEIHPKSLLDYYYLGMAKIAIALLNQVSFDLFLNHHCHKGIDFEVDIADNRARDLCELYRYQYLSYDEIIKLIDELSTNEKYYFIVRLIYPSFYFDHPRDNELLEKMLPIYRKQIETIINVLCNQIAIPTLLW